MLNTLKSDKTIGGFKHCEMAVLNSSQHDNETKSINFSLEQSSKLSWMEISVKHLEHTKFDNVQINKEAEKIKPSNLLLKIVGKL